MSIKGHALSSPDITVTKDGHVVVEGGTRYVAVVCPHAGTEHIVTGHDGHAYVVSEALTAHTEGDACLKR